MAGKKVTKEQRNLIRANVIGRLMRIVGDSQEIIAEMNQLPSRRGQTPLSLIPRSGTYVLRTADGRRETISATYKADDGKWYDITITNHGELPVNPHYKLPFIKP